MNQNSLLANIEPAMLKTNRVWISLFRRVFDKPLPAASDEEIALLRELREKFAVLQAGANDKASEIETPWTTHVNRLCELVLNDDPREFLRWDVIRETMFVSDADFIVKELRYLTELPDWSQRWKKAIVESAVGHPSPCPFYGKSSGTLIHHAYHLARFEKQTGIPVDRIDSVFEFGGGYGSMCRLFNNLGFKGRYLLFDLPHISALQEFYLKSLGIKVNSSDTFKTTASGVTAVSDPDKLAQLVKAMPPSNSMFVATWSMSEAPIEIRRAVLPLIRDFSAFLVTYQEHYDEVDNGKFFQDWQESMDKEISWHLRAIDHMPGNTYLFGNRTLAR